MKNKKKIPREKNQGWIVIGQLAGVEPEQLGQWPRRYRPDDEDEDDRRLLL